MNGHHIRRIGTVAATPSFLIHPNNVVPDPTFATATRQKCYSRTRFGGAGAIQFVTDPTSPTDSPYVMQFKGSSSGTEDFTEPYYTAEGAMGAAWAHAGKIVTMKMWLKYISGEQPTYCQMFIVGLASSYYNRSPSVNRILNVPEDGNWHEFELSGILPANTPYIGSRFDFNSNSGLYLNCASWQVFHD